MRDYIEVTQTDPDKPYRVGANRQEGNESNEEVSDKSKMVITLIYYEGLQ